MQFDEAIHNLHALLQKKDPPSFDRGWVRIHAPWTYRFFQRNVRTETGGIDWDRVTRALNRDLQKRWMLERRPSRKPRAQYKNSREVEIIIKKYRDKLYAFLAPADEHDKHVRDLISIALVRMAQKGNIIAAQEVTKLLKYTIDEWIESSPRLSRWKGYETELQEQLAGCIRRYRYSGSFVVYLFRTLEYAGRGLRPLQAYSLDDCLPDGDKTKIDLVVKDPETNEIRMYG